MEDNITPNYNEKQSLLIDDIPQEFSAQENGECILSNSAPAGFMIVGENLIYETRSTLESAITGAINYSADGEMIEVENKSTGEIVGVYKNGEKLEDN